MSDIFISYAREDTDVVSKLAEALERQGWSVWWDRAIVTGERFPRIIEKALTEARVVMVVWSRHSVESDWVRAEANEGLSQKKLMPVRIDEAEPPLLFRQVHTADLRTWRAGETHTGFRQFTDHLAARLQADSPSSVQEAREHHTPPRRPTRLLALTALGLILLGAIGAGLYVFHQHREKETLARSLAQRAIDTLLMVETRSESERNAYWSYLWQSTDRPRLVERTLLLALESLRRGPSPEAYTALDAALALMTRPLARFAHDSSADVTLSPDGQKLASVASGGSVDVHQADKGNLVERFEQQHQVRALAWGPEGSLLATGNDTGEIHLWEPGHEHPLLHLSVDQAILDLTFSADGGLLAALSGPRRAGRTEARIRVWRLPAAEEILARDIQLAEDRHLLFNPAGADLALADSDNRIRVWTPESGGDAADFPSSGTVNRLAFDPNGRLLASASTDGFAQVWQMLGRRLAHTLPHDRAVEALAFSPNGKTLATGGRDGLVIIWDMRDGHALRIMRHEDRIIDLAWSQAGTYLVSASQDGTARLWQAEDGSELRRMNHAGNVDKVMFGSEDARLISASNDGFVRIWNMPSEDPLAEACRVLDRNLSVAEWREYIGDEPYQATCPNRGAGPDR